MNTTIDLSSLAKKNPEESIREHTDKLHDCEEKLQNIYHYDNHLHDILHWACEYHDYGKANSAFKSRIGKDYHVDFDSDKELPHNFLSVYFIDKEKFACEEDYLIACYAVLHHHVFRMEGVSDILRNRSKLIDETLNELGYPKLRRKTFKKISSVKNEPETVLVKGLLHRCDYAASAGIEVEHENNFLSEAMETMMEKWKNDKKADCWNPLQEFCQNHQKNNLIITAPTGMGKTEAALKWIGNHKGIYILPLRSAINSMYDRIRKDVLDGCDNIDNCLALLHSDNISYLMNNYGKIDEEEKDWMEYKTKAKQFSLPLTISTPDQFFDFVFCASGYELKLATAAFSKIVIDEIQAYDAKLLAYVIYGIHQIIKLGGKVAVLTATLPPFVRNLLLQVKDNPDDSGFLQEDFTSEQVRHNVKVYDEFLAAEPIIEKCLENKSKLKSNKILVICNTVKKAQEIFKNLQVAEIPDVEIKMLHSKFTKEDRRNLEKEISADGKTDCKKDVIWVATQVVEASLDIDFDYLFTELSELNGLFQRLGRCNRKGLKSTEEPNCFVFTKIDPYLVSNNGFIDETLYNLSKKALASVDGILTETEKKNLLDEFFTTENMSRSKYMITYRETYDFLSRLEVDNLSTQDVEQQFRNIIAYDVIPESVYSEFQEEIEEAFHVLKDKNASWENRQREKNKIMDKTVSVGIYEMMAGKMDWRSLGKNQNIYILECSYDKQRGFVRKQKDKDNNQAIRDYGMFL
ncbi:MAG: CRISPR-associated helicase Cas3' [Lachnospiraceae bacterium]|nr:CRISPR-associated helicase Cas3' [Lachnospiraceae bacterium]